MSAVMPSTGAATKLQLSAASFRTCCVVQRVRRVWKSLVTIVTLAPGCDLRNFDRAITSSSRLKSVAEQFAEEHGDGVILKLRHKSGVSIEQLGTDKIKEFGEKEVLFSAKAEFKFKKISS